MDLGCGEGLLHTYFEKDKKKKSLFKEILSFDLVSLKDFIKAEDIRNLPLEDKTRDIAVFCLALMGTNYLEFLIEAERCLKIGGFLIISEVNSRIPNHDFFCTLVNSLGFELYCKVTKTIKF